jgi:hypothetical protein
MNKQQTAVEWLQNEIWEHIEWKPQLEKRAIAIKFEKAKEMEKESLMDCWDTSHQVGRFEGKGIAEENWQTFEQYYNETYE